MTIVVPTFNCAATIRDCAISIFEQAEPDFSVLFVDGGSTDGTIEILNEVSAGKSNACVISEPDRGIYDAMNKGIARSKGEWLYFLGGDDSLRAPDVLASVMPHLTDDVDFVYGDVEHLHASGETQLYDGAFTPAKLARKNISHQAIFYRASLFREYGPYDLKYRIFADWAFNLRVFPLARARYVRLTVAMCRLDGRSSSVADPHFYLDKLDLIFANTPAILHREYAYNLHRLFRLFLSSVGQRNPRSVIKVATIILSNASARFLGGASRLP